MGLRQVAVQLCGLLGLRKNELRLLTEGDFDLGKGTFVVQARAGRSRSRRSGSTG
jgi:hypothetical protein